MPAKEKHDETTAKKNNDHTSPADSAEHAEIGADHENSQLPLNDPEEVNQAAQVAEQAVIDAVKGTAHAVQGMKNH
jgi:hypothetical protein